MREPEHSYNTEIRGDGLTHTWTLLHALGTKTPWVTVIDAEGNSVTDDVRIGLPSAGEISITFPRPPRFGQRYEIKVVA
jgi:hypothetical protein